MATADSEAARPDPEALLAAATRAERSRLKVFVGAAPGVGKTFAMLQAALQLHREGVDVVIGIVETHGRAETQALLEGLPVIPRRRVEYRGQTLEEMDLDAILARHPAVVLVDELAHTNAPGSRHSKRYLDVEELLDAGIEVYTTVNIQHLESLNDVVAQITGIRVRETVPDRVLDRADEVRLIDLSPEELMQRLREGKVYVPQQAERALRNWFQPGKLTALRELALRETAEHVDEQVQAHMRAHAVPGPWPVTDRLLVAVSGGPSAETLVRAARRMAERRAVPWLAVFVELPRFHVAPEAERERVARALRLAEQLGGETVTVPGHRVADDLVRFARERNVTEMVLGKPRHPRWWTAWRPSVVDQVLRQSAGIEIRLVGTGAREAEAAAAARLPPTLPVRARARAPGYLFAAVAVAVAGLVATGLQSTLPLDDPSMVFLAAVLATAVAGGLGPAIAASFASLLVYDFFFVQPLHTLTVTKPQDVLSLIAFLLVAVLTSNLMVRVRDQAEAARRREERTAALYAFARAIAATTGLDDLTRVVAEHVARLFAAQTSILLPEAGRLVLRAEHPDRDILPADERGTAMWVWQRNQLAGRGTDTLPGSEWLHVPLATARGAVGVLSLRPEKAGAVLPLEQRQLLEALAGQAAVAVERTRVDVTEAIIESIQDGLVVLDSDGRVAHVNEVACAILEVERNAAVGELFTRLGTDHPHYLRLRGAVHELLAHPALEPEAVEMALFLRGRDHYFVLRPTPLKALDGTRAGLILVLQDVTHLRDQDARREQLMATLSHELRTPLTSLRMALELLTRSDGAPPEERARLLATAREDTTRLEDVARRLLDVSRSRAMTIALERQPVDLGDVVAEVERVFALQAREHGVVLARRNLGGDLTVTGDVTKLTWALSNLVGNALRYTPRDGRIAIETAGDETSVRVTVADTGPGIPTDQQVRIFERFVQGDDRSGAAGLGLAIVRDIVQAHGGRIHLDSAPGTGSRFTVVLPRA